MIHWRFSAGTLRMLIGSIAELGMPIAPSGTAAPAERNRRCPMAPSGASRQPKNTKEDPLVAQIDRLSHALGAEIPGRERMWAESLDKVLADVERALQQHMMTAQDPDGVFAEVDETRPSLARQAGQLRQDHDGLLGQCLALREAVRQAAGAFSFAVPTSLPTPGSATRSDQNVPDLGAIRRQAEQLRDALRQNLQAETHLVLDSINTDIGVGD
jgi:hypothetical protein